MRLGLTVSTSLLAVVACSNGARETPGVAEAGLPAAPQASVVDDAVRLIARGAPSFARFLAPNPERGFREQAGALTSFGWRATDQKIFEHLAARLPMAANGAVEVGPGRLERFQLRLSPLGARASMGATDEGRVVYRDAYPSTDVIAVTTAQTFEEFLLLRDEAAPSAFSWSIELPRGIKRARFEDTGALVFADVRDEGVLRMPPPFAVDANGVKRDAKLEWNGRVATVSLDTQGLAYPILLDPALEQFLWEKKASSGAPGQRNGPMMTFHPSTTLLVGGSNSGGTNLADTWEWNGTTWTQRCGAPLASCAISPNPGNQLAYHAALNRSVYAGFSQTAQWNGSVWTSAGSLPSGTYGGDTLVYQSNPPSGAAPRLLMYGGGFLQNDIIAWNGSWTRIYGPATCSTASPCVFNHAAAYDSNTRRLVSFGGDGNPNPPPPGATREWDDVALTSKTTSTIPIYRMAHRMVYDSVRKRVVMFGGYPGGGASYDDTWEYYGGNWSLVSAITKPPPRSSFGMAFDSARGRVVVYGGINNGALVPADVWELHSFGGACTTAAECDTGACVDGVCCESTSCGTCQACNLSVGPGTCRTVASADDPDTCATTSTCDVTGTCKKRQGEACTASSQCLSSYCVDGVCCASACTGTCQACAAAEKQSGIENGICGPAKDGRNPHGDCTATTAMSCGQTGVCNGTGTCKLWPDGTACGSGVCDGNTFKGQQCNGTGSCLSNPTGTACAPGKCISSTGCKYTCTSNTDCDSSAFCDGGNCKAKKANGETCTAASECQNPFCVDGVCCNKPCAGQCEACNSTGAVGTCVPIAGEPVGARTKCDASTAGEPCKARRCDGVDGTTCAGYAGAGTPCRTAACTDGKAVTDLFCDGKGSCPTDAPKVCAPFICNGTVCKDTCASDTDCVAPSTCETSSGKCVDASKCDGDHTVTSADGKTTTDCAPYKCDASGKCRTTCASTSECAGAAVCGSGVCTAPAPSGDSGDSGGCAIGAPAARSGGGLLALVLIAASRLRRRR